MTDDPNILSLHTAVSGKLRMGVHDPATGLTDWVAEKENMITDWGLEGRVSAYWRDLMRLAQISEETMITRETVAGTYSQSGTTVTRDSGARDFDATRYSDTVMALTPLAYYKFHETAVGTIADSSGNAHNGTINGAAYAKSFLMPPFTPVGTQDRGSLFNATTNSINYGKPASLEFDMDVTPFSISLWFSSLPSTNASQTILKKTGSSDNPTSVAAGQFGLTMVYYTANPGAYQGLLVRVGGAPTLFQTGVPIADGDWHHLAVSSNGTTTTVYIDGNIIGTVTNGTTQESAVDWVSLAVMGSGTNNNTGSNGSGNAGPSYPFRIAHLAFFGTALTHAQIKVLQQPVEGDRGKTIKWSTGEEAKILSVTSATVCEVDISQTVAATNINLHHTGLFKVTCPILISSPSAFTMDDGRASNGVLRNSNTGVFNNRRTWDGPIETVAKTYRTFGLCSNSNNGVACGVIVDASATPVSVAIGKQVRFTYDFEVTHAGFSAASIAAQVNTGTLTGWPEVYSISGIVNNGASFTITTTAAHHFVATGTRKINVAGSSAHFNGEWTVGSVTSTTIVINSTVVGANAGAGGTVYNNVKRTFRMLGSPIMQPANVALDGFLDPNYNSTNATKGDYVAAAYHPTVAPIFFLENNISPAIPTAGTGAVVYWDTSGNTYVVGSGSSQGVVAHGYNSGQAATGVLASYVPWSFYRDATATFTAAQGNGTAIRRLLYQASNIVICYWLFEEPQLKKNTHTLAVTLRRSWGRTLPATPP